MPQINGENLVPNGGLTGGAYVLGNRTPDALTLLVNGERARQINGQRETDRRLKRDQELSKIYNDAVNFKRSASPYFSKGLESQMYAPLSGDLTNVFKQNRDDNFARNVAARPILDRADMETKQSEAKTKYLHDTLATFNADKNLYSLAYAGEHLAKYLHDGDRNKLPSETDVETWHNGIMADPNLYNEVLSQPYTDL
jgi:hypothetical protein